MEAAVRAQAVACAPCPGFKLPGFMTELTGQGLGLHKGITRVFCSGRTLEVLSRLLAPPSRDEETDVQGGGAFLELHRLLIDILIFLRTLTARHHAKCSTFITLFICTVIHE